MASEKETPNRFHGWGSWREVETQKAPVAQNSYTRSSVIFATTPLAWIGVGRATLHPARLWSTVRMPTSRAPCPCKRGHL